MKTAMYKEIEKSESFKLFMPYRPWTSLSNWWANIKWFLRSFKLAAQRVKRGYCDVDLMDFGDYMIRMAALGLEDFANKTWSYPGPGYGGVDEDDDERAFKIWKAEISRASMNLFQSMEELEEFNYKVPEAPECDLHIIDNKIVDKVVNNEDEWRAYFKEREKISEDRYKHLNDAMDWLKEHILEIWC